MPRLILLQLQRVKLCSILSIVGVATVATKRRANRNLHMKYGCFFVVLVACSGGEPPSRPTRRVHELPRADVSARRGAVSVDRVAATHDSHARTAAIASCANAASTKGESSSSSTIRRRRPISHVVSRTSVRDGGRRRSSTRQPDEQSSVREDRLERARRRRRGLADERTRRKRDALQVRLRRPAHRRLRHAGPLDRRGSRSKRRRHDDARPNHDQARTGGLARQAHHRPHRPSTPVQRAARADEPQMVRRTHDRLVSQRRRRRRSQRRGSAAIAFNYSATEWRLQRSIGASYTQLSQPVPNTTETATVSFAGS